MFNKIFLALAIAHARYISAEIPVEDKAFLLYEVSRELYKEEGGKVYDCAYPYLVNSGFNFLTAQELARRAASF